MTTLKGLSDYLLRIRAEDATFGGEPQPAATQDDLNKLSQQVYEQFAYRLPESYLSLLAMSDGINFNSYTLYSSRTLPITGYIDRFIEGFAEAEDLWEDYENNDDHHLLVFGETGGDLFLFDQRDQKFKATDKVGGNTYDEFNTFEELAERLFKNTLGIFENEDE